MISKGFRLKSLLDGVKTDVWARFLILADFLKAACFFIEYIPMIRAFFAWI